MSKTTQQILIITLISSTLAACGGGGGSSGADSVASLQATAGTTGTTSGTGSGASGSSSSGTSAGTTTGGSTATDSSTSAGGISGSASGGASGSGGTSAPLPTANATQARFNGPTGIAFGSNGDLYVADTGNYTVRKITVNGVVTTLAGRPGVQGAADGVGANALFTQPRGVAVDGSGNIYVTDGSAVRKITPAGVVTTVAGAQGDYGNSDGVGAAARFRTPDGIVLDKAGNAYVADSDTFTIRKIVTATGAVSTLAGGNGNTNIDGTGTRAGFVGPTAIGIDGANNLYVADMSVVPGTTPIPLRGSSFLRKITPAGVVTTVAGNLGHTAPATDTVPRATFSNSSGLAVDIDGTVYITDHYNRGNFVKVVRPDGTVSTRVQDTSGVSFLSRLAYNPVTKQLYGTDESNHTILWLTTSSDGRVDVIAGKRGEAGSADTP
jgi:sugar lactone lactonase YvrE